MKEVFLVLLQVLAAKWINGACESVKVLIFNLKFRIFLVSFMNARTFLFRTEIGLEAIKILVEGRSYEIISKLFLIKTSVLLMFRRIKSFKKRTIKVRNTTIKF